jgi:hypothetical protein
VIDLHLHTTASDGRCSPGELVTRAAAAGLTTLAVTDHDTTAATAEVRASAEAHGIAAVPGIEITAVEGGRDVHVLGYFLDASEPGLVRFLKSQREIRVERIKAIAARLAELGMPIVLSPLLDAAEREPHRAVGRPQVALAMVAARHVVTTHEAFDRFLAVGRPAFVPRQGHAVETVVEIIHRAGGLASLAHPGRTEVDRRIPAFAAAGLDCLEVYHSDHDEATTERYRQTALQLGLLMTGGSDFHGDPGRSIDPGAATLPADQWRRLEGAQHRHAPR